MNSVKNFNWYPKIKLLGGSLVVLLACVSRAEVGVQPYRDTALSIEERVEDLLGRMTVAEKVAQMRMFRSSNLINLNEENELVLEKKVKERLEFGIAGIKNPGANISPEQSALLNNQLQKYIIENNRLGIPALFVTESYRGVNAKGSTWFSRPITSAASWNVELVKEVWDAVGREARLRGMHMCHSPVADIHRDPRFGRMSEGFGEDTFLTSEMVVAAISGVQGDYEGLSAGTHIGAVVKHFAGYGQVQGGLNFASIEMSPRGLVDEILPPFKAAVERAGVLGVMASHGDVNGVAAHANEELLTDVLRDQWGFEGYVVSDANDIARLHFFMKVAETPEAAAEMALVAGLDVDLYSDEAYALLPEMVKTSPELISYIDRSVRRVLRTKFVLGLFDQPYTDVSAVASGVRSQESLDLALQSDLESIILLKNDGNVLPLEDGAYQKVALLGPLLGEGTLDAFERVSGDRFQFKASEGFELTDGDGNRPALLPDDPASLDELVKLAEESDLVILFLGGDKHTAKEAYFMEGNLGDRDSIDPVGAQDELLRRVKALGKPVVVVLKHRRTLSINAISELADGIVDCWELSEFGDQAIAEIVTGKVCPSGKLPVTVPRSIGQVPFHYSRKEINFRKGYLFSSSEPLYCFGHGLSYTSFEYGELVLPESDMKVDGQLTVSVEVRNSGTQTGKEVVQLYVKDQIGSVVRPQMELKGFEKIELEPGESQTVSFEITAKQLAFTGKDMLTDAEPGWYSLFVGTSSSDNQEISFQLRED